MGNSQTIVKVHEQSVRYYKEDSRYDGSWVDAQLALNSAGDLIVSAKDLKKIVEITLSPFVEIGPPSHGVYEGIFVIHSEPESEYSTGPRFACKKPEDTERWIQLLSYATLKKRLSLRHNHPLTRSKQENPCSVCATLQKSNAKSKSPLLAPLYKSGGWICEFCQDYAQCNHCHSRLEEFKSPLVKSPNHEHQLLRLDSASGFWVEKGYGGRYECDKCGTTSDSVVYHCVECGGYDECPKCALKGNETKDELSKKPSDLELELKDLAHVIESKGQKYSLNVAPGKLCPEHMSLKTSKYWDLISLEQKPATHAYMEVTFDDLAQGALVAVGIGNQIFGQNEMLGYQQNSFAVFNNGTACVNSSGSAKDFFDMKFGKGDIIGVGVLFDSYNQRKVFFTKNGQYVGIIEDTVHKGMDCFPGVSFTKQSRVSFTVNFTGPFKFDVNTLPNYRNEQRDRISLVPGEIMNMIAGFSTISIAQVRELRKVNKKFAESYLSNPVWKTLYLQHHTNQNPDLKIKSWYKFYKRRATEVKLFDEPIENCGFEFECPMSWDNLKEDPNNRTERFCDKCQKTVYRVSDPQTMKEYTEMGRCTVFANKLESIRDWEDMEMGRRMRPPSFNYVSPWEK